MKGIKNNLHYFEISKTNPEKLLDDFYIFDERKPDLDKYIQNTKEIKNILITIKTLELKNEKSEVIEKYFLELQKSLGEYSNCSEFGCFINACDNIIDGAKNEISVLKEVMKPGRVNSYSRRREIENYLEEKMFGAGKISIDSKDERKKFKNRFYYLLRRGLVDVEYRGNQVYISLTEEGKKKAGKYKIDDLKIKTAEKWDKNWRVLIFDIEDRHKAKREALRGKIKQLGLFQLQKAFGFAPMNSKKRWMFCAIFSALNPMK